MFKNEEGFSLLELVVAVGVAGIIAAVALPTFAGLQDKATTTSATYAASASAAEALANSTIGGVNGTTSNSSYTGGSSSSSAAASSSSSTRPSGSAYTTIIRTNAGAYAYIVIDATSQLAANIEAGSILSFYNEAFSAYEYSVEGIYNNGDGTVQVNLAATATGGYGDLLSWVWSGYNNSATGISYK